MGLGKIVKRIKQKGKIKAAKERKRQRRKKRNDEKVDRIIIEETKLLSREQLKKISKQPTNNIRVSGKRKRKELKRLRHAQKDKSQMDVEEAGPSKVKSDKPSTMDTDEEDESSHGEGDVEMS